MKSEEKKMETIALIAAFIAFAVVTAHMADNNRDEMIRAHKIHAYERMSGL